MWHTTYTKVATVTIGGYGSRKVYKERKRETPEEFIERIVNLILDYRQGQMRVQERLDRERAEWEDFVAWSDDMGGQYNVHNNSLFDYKNGRVIMTLETDDPSAAEKVMRLLAEHAPEVLPLKES